MEKKIIIKFLSKIIQLIFLILAVSFIAFWLIDQSPIDPIVSFSRSRNIGLTDEQKEKLIAQWDLNRPFIERFILWFKNLIQGDLGVSNIYNKPVISIVKEGFSSSILLMFLAWILQGFIGFLLGIISGIKVNTFIDKIITRYAIVISSTPTFWVALLMIMFFSLYLGWFPIGFGSPIGLAQSDVTWLDRIYYAMLPAITLALVGTGNIILHTRKKVIEIMNSEFILYQKSRGITGFDLITRTALRNVAFPMITIQFSNFSELFSGAILAERAFNYQGLGNYSVEAGLRGDLPLLLGISFYSALFVFVGNQLADLFYLFSDHRIRKGGLI
ncbi:ABC transporter permease [Ignavigranum ruoffiae]|uniref:ABC transporter permease n=1 Tax=Ignavigranum ruoffiae TaxID=89093 RepID=UPI0024AD98A2|nr:ABC transporter permease [Ignavigranum ruoffiae]